MLLEVTAVRCTFCGTVGACVSSPTLTLTVLVRVAPNHAYPSRTIRQSVVRFPPELGAVIVKLNV